MNKLPKAFFLAILIVFLVETSIYFCLGKTSILHEKERFYPLDRVPDICESIMQWQIHNIFSDSIAHQDIILLGDSSCLMGLRPKIIMQATGRDTWNFGTLAWISIGGHLKILQALTEEKGKPEIVVYHTSLWPLEADRKTIDDIGYYKRFESHMANESGVAGNLLLPSLCFREKTRKSISSFFDSQNTAQFTSVPRPPFPSDDGIREQLIEHRGAMTEVRKSNDIPKPLENTPQISQDASKYLKEMFTYVQKNSIKLIVVFNPLPDFADFKETRIAFDNIEKQLLALSSNYSNVSILTPILRFYPDQLCSSDTHLLHAGATRNSEEISHYLNHHILQK